MKTNKFLIIAVILIAAAAAAVTWANRGDKSDNSLPGNPDQTVQQPSTQPDPSEENDETEIKSSVLLNVPFVAQAPTANWDDPRQQDGCEEASVLMAWLWIEGQTSISASEAERAIIAISEFEEETYGSYRDTNAADTARFMKDYYDYDKVSVVNDPQIDDIKAQLSAGKLVLVPANGQRLGNPYFSGDGPLTHMVVIKGYDDAKGQFITNDPGTRRGNSYAYSYQTLFNAMVDYPSGDSHGSQAGRGKAMIVVEK